MTDDTPDEIIVEPCMSASHPGWLDLRQALWSDGTPEEHLAEMASAIAEPSRYAQFVACRPARKPVGLAEASIRSDYVNGTSTSPVAFLEGIYVIPGARQTGVAAALVAEVCRWAAAMGCKEIGSDALLENTVSHAVHRALGFEEMERVVFFRKTL